MSLSAQDPIVHLVRPRNGYNCPRNFHRLSRSLEKKEKERKKQGCPGTVGENESANEQGCRDERDRFFSFEMTSSTDDSKDFVRGEEAKSR